MMILDLVLVNHFLSYFIDGIPFKNFTKHKNFINKFQVCRRKIIMLQVIVIQEKNKQIMGCEKGNLFELKVTNNLNN